ncbi:hypothetical protein QJQ45_013286 [Haematococcus lacustris]|nr:hypothetical protein QJQ45_013286 [Haematococcus lacustris]
MKKRKKLKMKKKEGGNPGVETAAAGKASGQYTRLLTHVLAKLGKCAAVETFKLKSRAAPLSDPLQSLNSTLWCDGARGAGPPVPAVTKDCGARLAERLLDSFPCLTALSIQGFSVTCSGLASLLSHPQLSLQLQCLDLSGSTILRPGSTILQPEQPGAVTLSSLFHGLRLRQLSLDAGSGAPLLPDLQPLAQHLTQLCIGQAKAPAMVVLGQVPLLQVLTLAGQSSLDCLPQLLQLLPALPQLHTLQLPEAEIRQQQLDALLAATQITSVQLMSVGFTSSHAAAPCSWQRLELTGSISYGTASCLPLHSLTQPLVLGRFVLSAPAPYDDSENGDYENESDEDEGRGEPTWSEIMYGVAAAVRNLTQACKVAVEINVLQVCIYNCLSYTGKRTLFYAEKERQQRRHLQEVMQWLKPLYSRCSMDEVMLEDLTKVNNNDIAAFAPWCKGCTGLHLTGCSLTPSLQFWRQLVQCMPSVTHVYLSSFDTAMCKSLKLMAEQPWARWLDIRISGFGRELPTHCKAIDRLFNNHAMPAKFRVCFEQ